MRIPLKPCPFCNGEALYEGNCQETEVAIFCDTCDAHSKVCTGVDRDVIESEAIAAWNTRPVDAILEQARKVADTRRSLHRGECRGEELSEALDDLAALIPASQEKPK